MSSALKNKPLSKVAISKYSKSFGLPGKFINGVFRWNENEVAFYHTKAHNISEFEIAVGIAS